MRNRAKCKLCNSTIESFMRNDYVTCSCGEISVNHGPALWVEAKDWNNFVRIDDEGNEIIVRYEHKAKDKDKNNEVDEEKEAHKPSRKELLSMLDDMIKSYENLPQHALLAPVSHADQLSLLMLLSSLLRSGSVTSI